MTTTNELNALIEKKAELETRLSYFFGYSWDSPTAKSICSQLDEINAQINAIPHQPAQEA